MTKGINARRVWRPGKKIFFPKRGKVCGGRIFWLSGEIVTPRYPPSFTPYLPNLPTCLSSTHKLGYWEKKIHSSLRTIPRPTYCSQTYEPSEFITIHPLSSALLTTPLLDPCTIQACFTIPPQLLTVLPIVLRLIQSATMASGQYPFVLVVDEHNEFAFYYAGTMDQGAMSKALTNLEYELLSNSFIKTNSMVGTS